MLTPCRDQGKNWIRDLYRASIPRWVIRAPRAPHVPTSVDASGMHFALMAKIVAFSVAQLVRSLTKPMPFESGSSLSSEATRGRLTGSSRQTDVTSRHWAAAEGSVGISLSSFGC